MVFTAACSSVVRFNPTTSLEGPDSIVLHDLVSSSST